MEVQAKHTVGKKLAALRKAKGLSQEKLAEEILISRQAVSRWELDIVTPGADNLAILGKAFSVSVDQLLDEGISPEQIVQLAREDRQEQTPQPEDTDPQSEEAPPPIQETPPRKVHPKELLLVGILSAVLAVALFVGLFWAVRYIGEDNEIIPLGEVEVVEDKNYTKGTFNLSPIG